MPECGQLVAVLKAGLCKLHYHRSRSGKAMDDPVRMKRIPGAICRMDDCVQPVYVAQSGLCNVHYLRLRRKGDADAPPAFIKNDDLRRYWSYVEKRGPDDCWPWTGGTRDGYGRLKVDGRMAEATRFLVGVVLGEPLSDDDEVCHHCDNPPCQNRRHLFIDDHLGNIQDMDAKGRCQRARGEESGMAKLTEAQVIEIRQRYRRYGRGADSGPNLAREFGVHLTTIERIVKRKLWRHVC